jgi:nicotinamide mononucleotide transporter
MYTSVKERDVSGSNVHSKSVGVFEWVTLAIISLVLLTLTYIKALPFDMTEMFGFVSGGLTVWLCVREHIANWPIGIINNVFFIILFFQARLFADTALQVVYIVLALGGWFLWLRGGEQKTGITVERTGYAEWLAMLCTGLCATLLLWRYLLSVGDTAPFLDALTTVMSLLAQYGLMRKRLENWLIWIAVDVIYIPLYVWKGLPLTGLLYIVFLLMCIKGFYDWYHVYRGTGAVPVAITPPGVALPGQINSGTSSAATTAYFMGFDRDAAAAKQRGSARIAAIRADFEAEHGVPTNAE